MGGLCHKHRNEKTVLTVSDLNGIISNALVGVGCVCIVLSVDVVSELEYIKTDSFLLLILLLLVFKVLIFLCSKYIACNKIKSKQ